MISWEHVYREANELRAEIDRLRAQKAELLAALQAIAVYNPLPYSAETLRSIARAAIEAAKEGEA